MSYIRDFIKNTGTSGTGASLNVSYKMYNNREIIDGAGKSTPKTIMDITLVPKKNNSKIIIDGIIWLSGGNRNVNDFLLKKTQSGNSEYIGKNNFKHAEGEDASKNAFANNRNWYLDGEDGSYIDSDSIFCIPFSFVIDNNSLDEITFEIEILGSEKLYFNRSYDNDAGSNNSYIKVTEI